MAIKEITLAGYCSVQGTVNAWLYGQQMKVQSGARISHAHQFESQDLDTSLQIQLPDNSPGKAVELGPTVWAPGPQVGDPQPGCGLAQLSILLLTTYSKFMFITIDAMML